MDDPTEEFLEAVKRGDARKVADLISTRPELARAADGQGKTGLHWAAESDGILVARVLVDAGADIEATTTWGASPLDWAANTGSALVAELLLARGASGLTLITAAALGKLSTVEGILTSGADLAPHRRRDAPRTPDDHWPASSAHLAGDVLSDALYAAARNGHAEVVEYLLARGASVDARGVFGATALHWAAMNGHEPVVNLLLARGARTDLQDARFSATPEGWAREGGHDPITDILRRHRSSA
jgi:ankyrin repeat protein